MDKRCPRRLDDHPGEYCQLAVLRLKAMRNAGRELTEEEEAGLPGCPFAVNHQLANYCFFKMMKEFSPENPLSDIEIAHTMGLSIETVKKVEKRALAKMRNQEDFVEMAKTFEGDKIVSDAPAGDWEFPK